MKFNIIYILILTFILVQSRLIRHKSQAKHDKSHKTHGEDFDDKKIEKYKKESEQKHEKMEKITAKINGAFEKVEKIVEKDFESNKNDEHFLLVTLTKLAIVKKAQLQQIKQMEDDQMVDLKIQESILKKIEKTQKEVNVLDQKDKVQQTIVSKPFWKIYSEFIESGSKFRTVFDRIVPLPLHRRYPGRWVGYVYSYFQFSYGYYWPYASFAYFRYSPYRFFSVLPATMQYVSFVGYYDYQYAIVRGEEYKEKKADDKDKNKIEEIPDSTSYEDLEKEFDEMSKELQSIIDDHKADANEILQEVTDSDEEEPSNLLGELDLEQPFEDQVNDVEEEDDDEKEADEDLDELNDLEDFEDELKDLDLDLDADLDDLDLDDDDVNDDDEEEEEEEEEDDFSSGFDGMDHDSDQIDRDIDHDQDKDYDMHRDDEYQEEGEEEEEEEEQDECSQFEKDTPEYQKCMQQKQQQPVQTHSNQKYVLHKAKSLTLHANNRNKLIASKKLSRALKLKPKSLKFKLRRNLRKLRRLK